MSKVIVDIGMSLDGFVAGPNGGPHNASREVGAAREERDPPPVTVSAS